MEPAYEGFWRCFHPSFTLPGRIARELAIIQREQGLLRMRMGGQGFEIDGPLLLIAGQLYGILADTPPSRTARDDLVDGARSDQQHGHGRHEVAEDFVGSIRFDAIGMVVSA